jgi:superoxide dismutase, Cu-Zn family
MASAGDHQSKFLTVVLAAAAITAIDMASGAWLEPLCAQQAERVSLSVAPMTHVAAASETQLPILVEPKAALPGNSFIRVSGLPYAVALSDGYATAPGSWSVPLNAGANLRVIVPVGTQGNSDVEINVVNREGTVFAQARTVLMIMPTPQSAAAHHDVITGATPPRDLDPSPLEAMHKGFDRFITRKGAVAKGKSPTAEQRAEMYRTFLTWPQNPLEVVAVVRFTSSSGVGDVVGTLTVRNSEILVAGRKEAALLIKPNLRGLRPGSFAFHVHENPNCGPATKDGEPVPGLAAGTHLWLSGTGALSGTTFSSHLGDLPKLQVEGDGTATKTVVAARLTLADVANRAFMIHASQDDNSARLACAPFH